MEFFLDSDVKLVLEFMQSNLPAHKLVTVSDVLPQMARLLWGRFPQEPCPSIELRVPTLCQSQSDANELAPEQLSVGGGFVAAKDAGE
jgi:hypothetical protein